MSFANAQVLGRLVADPELVNYGNEGKHLARFRIAANVRKDKAVFYNGIAFNQQADVMGKYLKKGSQVFLEGYFQNNSAHNSFYNFHFVYRSFRCAICYIIFNLV